MVGRGVIAILGLWVLALPCASGADRWQVAQATLPTLDQAVFLEARVDRDEVYLGEPVELTLVFGELAFRGIRLQGQYRGRPIPLPDTEGFFLAHSEMEEGRLQRGEFFYTTKTRRVTLFPARAGDLYIGAWRWQGTVRGYTASGARTLSIDRRTEPITVQVKPLPPAPPGFDGAVGAYTMTASLAQSTLTQGQPVTFAITVTGTGNAQSLPAPRIPGSAWFELSGDPGGPAQRSGQSDDQFSKQFTFELMPLQPGNYELGPLTMTYFSPASEQYETATVPAMAVTVAPSETRDELVVVGAGAYDGIEGLTPMADGRLPLAHVSGSMASRRDWRGPLFWMACLPVFLAVPLWAAGMYIRYRRASHRVSPVRTRMERALGASPTLETIRIIVQGDIARQAGLSVWGLTAVEVERALLDRGWGNVALELGEILRALERRRYGKSPASDTGLRELAIRAVCALEAVGGQGGTV